MAVLCTEYIGTLRALSLLAVALVVSWSGSTCLAQSGVPSRCDRLVELAMKPSESAQPGPSAVQEAEQQLKAAADRYRQQQFDDALAAIERAYLLYPSAAALYNGAQSCREAGAEKAALLLYEQSAARGQNPILRSESLRRGAELRRKLARDDEMRAVVERQRALADQQRLILEQQAALTEQRRIDAERVARLTASPPQPAAPQRTSAPLHRRWWFWSALGGAVVATVAVSAGLAYAFPRQPRYPNLKDVTFK